MYHQIVIDKPTIAVWFSCGVASAVAAKKTIEMYADKFNIRVLNNPVKEEDPDNTRFLKDVEQWLGVQIEQVVNSKYPNHSAIEVWDKTKSMSFPDGAPCTTNLKRLARHQWEMVNDFQYFVFGFTVDEKHRSETAKIGRPDLLEVLIDANLTKKDCFQIVKDAGLKLPRIYELGYPNANCIGCVKATSPTYWNHVRVQHPDVFQQRSEQSERLGVNLVRVKGKRIMLKDLDPKAKGYKMKNLHMECGAVCGLEA